MTSPAGTILLGRHFGTQPHTWGAVLGGILGIGAGVGAVRLFANSALRSKALVP